VTPAACYTGRVSRFAPFESLRYDTSVAGSLATLTAPPYDVINVARRRGYVDANPYNIVHVDLPDEPGDGALAGPDGGTLPLDRYAAAARRLDTWIASGVLRRHPPSYLVYEMRWDEAGRSARIRGVVCAMRLAPWGTLVLPHEGVMPGPVSDRLRLLRATRTHLSAVYGSVDVGSNELAVVLDATVARPPWSSLVDAEGVQHALWTLDAATDFDRWLGGAPLVIADGHHRYTTALAYQQERRDESKHDVAGRILTFMVDAGSERLDVLPYHRVVMRGELPGVALLGGGTDVATLGAALAATRDDPPTVATIRRREVGPPLAAAEPTTSPDGDVIYRIHALAGGPPAVKRLHELWLDAMTPGATTAPGHGETLRFTHDATDADRLVRSGQARGAYLLAPTSLAAIQRVVTGGERLPQKSTFFWPKPRTGMVMMPLDPALSRPPGPPVS